MRYSLTHEGHLVEGIGWRKKSHAEYWIQQHLVQFGGLDWRVGGRFKARRGDMFEIVHTRTLRDVDWYGVFPEEYEYFEKQLKITAFGEQVRK